MHIFIKKWTLAKKLKKIYQKKKVKKISSMLAKENLVFYPISKLFILYPICIRRSYSPNFDFLTAKTQGNEK